jgi:hypothetical protein
MGTKFQVKRKLLNNRNYKMSGFPRYIFVYLWNCCTYHSSLIYCFVLNATAYSMRFICSAAKHAVVNVTVKCQTAMKSTVAVVKLRVLQVILTLILVTQIKAS